MFLLASLCLSYLTPSNLNACTYPLHRSSAPFCFSFFLSVLLICFLFSFLFFSLQLAACSQSIEYSRPLYSLETIIGIRNKTRQIVPVQGDTPVPPPADTSRYSRYQPASLSLLVFLIIRLLPLIRRCAEIATCSLTPQYSNLVLDTSCNTWSLILVCRYTLPSTVIRIPKQNRHTIGTLITTLY